MFKVYYEVNIINPNKIMGNPENFNNHEGGEETPEQKEVSDALKRIGENTDKPGEQTDVDGDLKQVVAEEFFKRNNAELQGPPSPEDYKNAEDALDELFDAVENEEKWGAVGDFCQRAIVIGGFAPMTLGRIIAAFAESRASNLFSPEDFSRRKPSFKESLKKEMREHIEAVKNMWTKYRPAGKSLSNLKVKAENLKKARARSNKTNN